MERAIMCPQCNAPLTAHRFASSVVCAYCGATVHLGEEPVSTEKFHKAFQTWNAPESYQVSSWISIGRDHWAIDRLLAAGQTCDVYAGRRARWPTELVVLKVLRDKRDAGLLENEWDVVKLLYESNSPGADTFSNLIPQPVLHGTITGGSFIGQKANIFRWPSGFYHTFEDVIKAYPQGIPPRASIWVWRRILEILSFIHASNLVHGAVIPSHLLVQENDHGVRLIGYSRAGKKGKQLAPMKTGDDSFYPEESQMKMELSNPLDIVMSARCIIAILGGNPSDATMPGSVPERLADIIRRTALAGSDDPACQNAWAIREELGHIADEIFGPPRFIPIIMPH